MGSAGPHLCLFRTASTASPPDDDSRSSTIARLASSVIWSVAGSKVAAFSSPKSQLSLATRRRRKLQASAFRSIDRKRSFLSRQLGLGVANDSSSYSKLNKAAHAHDDLCVPPMHDGGMSTVMSEAVLPTAGCVRSVASRLYSTAYLPAQHSARQEIILPVFTKYFCLSLFKRSLWKDIVRTRRSKLYIFLQSIWGVDFSQLFPPAKCEVPLAHASTDRRL